jgi:hypothetical protein
MTDQPIDRALVAEWAAALEGGEYRQAQGALRVGDAYCCLGVVCDLLVRRGELPGWQPISGHGCGKATHEVAHEVGALPRPVAARLDLAKPNGYLRGGWLVKVAGRPTPFVTLAEANDAGASFAAIAAAIRRELLGEGA